MGNLAEWKCKQNSKIQSLSRSRAHDFKFGVVCCDIVKSHTMTCLVSSKWECRHWKKIYRIPFTNQTVIKSPQTKNNFQKILKKTNNINNHYYNNNKQQSYQNNLFIGFLTQLSYGNKLGLYYYYLLFIIIILIINWKHTITHIYQRETVTNIHAPSCLSVYHFTK